MTIENAVAESTDSGAFVRHALDALTEHVAVLDAEGRVLAVNAAWRAFALENGGEPERTQEGADYLAVCDAAASAGERSAAEFAAGVRSVAAGDVETFALVYPCHSPAEQRWFSGRVTRFVHEGDTYLVVAHENVTARKTAEEQLERQERHFRGLIEASRVDVRLEEREDGLVLRIADDGVGFSQAETALGTIAAMRERAELIGGTLDVRSAPGSGTTVELWLPS